MSVSVQEMLDTLDAAIRDTPWWLPNAPALELIGRRMVLGQLGDRVKIDPRDISPDTPLATPVSHQGDVFVFTRRQCKKMRKVIINAAREAATPAPRDEAAPAAALR